MHLYCLASNHTNLTSGSLMFSCSLQFMSHWIGEPWSAMFIHVHGFQYISKYHSSIIWYCTMVLYSTFCNSLKFLDYYVDTIELFCSMVYFKVPWYYHLIPLCASVAPANSAWRFQPKVSLTRRLMRLTQETLPLSTCLH